MKKVTSLLIAAFTTAIFAGSAMAATPAQHTSQKPVAHHTATHKTHKQHQTNHVKKHSAVKTAPQKAENKAPVAAKS